MNPIVANRSEYLIRYGIEKDRFTQALSIGDLALCSTTWRRQRRDSKACGDRAAVLSDRCGRTSCVRKFRPDGPDPRRQQSGAEARQKRDRQSEEDSLGCAAPKPARGFFIQRIARSTMTGREDNENPSVMLIWSCPVDSRSPAGLPFRCT